jgi:hypothetical protein
MKQTKRPCHALATRPFFVNSMNGSEKAPGSNPSAPALTDVLESRVPSAEEEGTTILHNVNPRRGSS